MYQPIALMLPKNREDHRWYLYPDGKVADHHQHEYAGLWQSMVDIDWRAYTLHNLTDSDLERIS